jgi:hypothetical protein
MTPKECPQIGVHQGFWEVASMRAVKSIFVIAIHMSRIRDPEETSLNGTSYGFFLPEILY